MQVLPVCFAIDLCVRTVKMGKFKVDLSQPLPSTGRGCFSICGTYGPSILEVSDVDILTLRSAQVYRRGKPAYQ